MNYLIALIVLIAYAVIHAHKTGTPVLEWVKTNKFTMIAAAGIMLLTILLPKVMTGALIAVYVLPILMSWGITSTVSNALSVLEKWWAMIFAK